jgi:uncharacterized membrane protein
VNHLPSSRTTPTSVALLVGGALIVAAAARVWLHDVLPYFVDYSAESYRRYWPNRQALMLHVLGGSLALFAGPFQLWSGFRTRFRRVHRTLGYLYAGGIALAATSSFALVFHTKADFGFALSILAVAWLFSTGMAVIAARNRRFEAHREWMIRSYIATFAFVAYRLLVSLSVFKGLGEGRHASVLWLSWVAPMMAFEMWNQLDRIRPVRRRAQPVAASGVLPASSSRDDR